MKKVIVTLCNQDVFTSEWINKLQFIHTMEYYSVIKRNDLSTYKEI